MDGSILKILLVYILQAASAILKYEAPEISFLHQHFLQCIQNITSTHFKPWHLVAVETPFMWKNAGTYQAYLSLLDVQHEFEDALIGLLSSHQVFLYGHSDDLESRNKTLLKPDAVVLLLNRGVFTRRDQLNLLQFMMMRIRTNAWNTEAKYLVISLDTFQTKQEHDSFLFKAFQYIRFYLRVVNVIVLIPTFADTTNRSDKSLDISVHTWYPFGKPGQCCGYVAEVNLINVWESRKGQFKWRSDVFPSKEKTDFNGCNILVKVRFGAPTAMIVDINGNNKLSGTDVLVMETAAKYSNL